MVVKASRKHRVRIGFFLGLGKNSPILRNYKRAAQSHKSCMPASAFLLREHRSSDDFRQFKPGHSKVIVATRQLKTGEVGMNVGALAGAIALCASTAICAAVVPVAPGTDLVPSQFVANRQPDGNSLIFRTPTGLVVMDTGRHPEHTQRIIDYAKAANLPIVAVITLAPGPRRRQPAPIPMCRSSRAQRSKMRCTAFSPATASNSKEQLRRLPMPRRRSRGAMKSPSSTQSVRSIPM